jgi:uroporphyrinogen III methyltransferase/synthase
MSAAGPLAGRSVLITRPRAQAERLARALAAEGAETILAPTIEIAPPFSWDEMDRAIAMGGYGWVVFTSANGVRYFWDRLEAAGHNARWFAGSRVAAIGPETARLLTSHGVRPDLVPEEFVAEALIACLADAGSLDGQRVLLPRADIAREALITGLRAEGALVDQVVAYRTTSATPPPGLIDRLRSGGIDVVTFTSSSTVRGLLEILGAQADALESAVIACIGPITAATARETGLEPRVVADVYTADGLVEALKRYYAGITEPASP